MKKWSFFIGVSISVISWRMKIIRLGFVFIIFSISSAFGETYNDDFDQGLSSLLWDTFQMGNYDYIDVECPDESGRVKISKMSHVFDGQSKKGGFRSRFILDGDLSIFVDFDLIIFPLTDSEKSFNEAVLAIVSAENGYDTLYCLRSTEGTKHKCLGYSNVLGQSFGSMIDTTLSGKFGITRVGNTITLYIDRGEGPFAFTSVSNDVFLGPVFVQIHIKQAGDPAPTTALDVRYDNFSATADQIIFRPRIISPVKSENIIADRIYEIKWVMPEQLEIEQVNLEYTTAPTATLIDEIPG